MGLGSRVEGLGLRSTWRFMGNYKWGYKYGLGFALGSEYAAHLPKHFSETRQKVTAELNPLSVRLSPKSCLLSPKAVPQP